MISPTLGRVEGLPVPMISGSFTPRWSSPSSSSAPSSNPWSNLNQTQGANPTSDAHSAFITNPSDIKPKTSGFSSGLSEPTGYISLKETNVSTKRPGKESEDNTHKEIIPEIKFSVNQDTLNRTLIHDLKTESMNRREPVEKHLSETPDSYGILNKNPGKHDIQKSVET